MKRHKIYLDQDGVLADFDKGFSDHHGEHPKHIDDEKMWDVVKAIPDWWLRLPTMEGFEKIKSFLFNYRF